MKSKSIAKWSYFIGVFSISAMLCWILLFIITESFEPLKLQRNIRDVFHLSIALILGLMVGSFIINTMSNLTRIAEKHEQAPKSEDHCGWLLAFLVSLPVILILLTIYENHQSIQKEQTALIENTRSIIAKYPDEMKRLLDYRFKKNWLLSMEEILWKIGNDLQLIVQDEINGVHVFLKFSSHSMSMDEEGVLEKDNYLMTTTDEEKKYLEQVFNDGKIDTRITRSNYTYTLFCPHVQDNKIIVFYQTE